MPDKDKYLTDEDAVVEFLRKRFAPGKRRIVQGIGDDAAVFLPRGADEFWVVTTDMLLENIDFRREWLTPEQLGHKALAINLSDLAAMGARPRFYTVAIGLPEKTKREWISRFYRGMTRLGYSEGAALLGGDLSRSQSLQITITAVGESKGRRVIYRSGARAGDVLYVTGALGLAAAGLKLLMAGRRRASSGYQGKALRAQRMPLPRCDVGLWLADSGLVSSMMDLSDGLSSDLPRLCRASGAGAEIEAARLPLFPHSALWQCNPLDLALHGGEDFELLFAVPRRKVPQFEKSYPKVFPKATRIGRLTDIRNGVSLTTPGRHPVSLPALGFDHFRGNPRDWH